MTAPRSTAHEQSALARIDKQELIDLTSALIAAGGENPGSTEAETVSVLHEYAHHVGLQTTVQPVAEGRENILITLGEASSTPPPKPGLLFLGHSDVVPAGNGWSHDPFTPYLQSGRLYGRGSSDMKGGLAAVLVALKALQDTGFPPHAPLSLLCAVDEEDLGLGIRAYIAAQAGKPFPYAACVVAEPTDLNTVISCRGDSYLEIQITGKSAHSGRPAEGRNAISAAGKILELIHADHERLQAAPHPVLGAGTWSPGLIHGGTGVSMVADSCTLSLDRRLLPEEDGTVILTELRQLLADSGICSDGISADVQLTMDMPGFVTDPASALPSTAVAAVADGAAISGIAFQSEITTWTAACDGGFIHREFGVPTVVLGPGGVNDQAHQVDESVAVSELLIAARAYTLLGLRYGSFDVT